MRPKPILWFERALLAAVVIELIDNIVALPTIARGLAMRGLDLGQPRLIAAVLIAPALGVLFWYFIARRGSVIAKWLMAAYIALGVIIFFRQMSATPLVAVNTMVLVAITAQLLKLFALLCLFVPSAQPWFRKEHVA